MSPTQRRRQRRLPPLLPKPASATARSGSFVLRDGQPIVLQPGASERDDATALRLRDGIAERSAVGLAIEGHRELRGLGQGITLRIDECVFEPHEDPEIAPQRYRIDVSADGTVVTATGSAGLRYGVETLLQLVGPTGRIPRCRIEDAPALAMRGGLSLLDQISSTYLKLIFFVHYVFTTG
jgi:hypothetical protein